MRAPCIFSDALLFFDFIFYTFYGRIIAIRSVVPKPPPFCFAIMRAAILCAVMTHGHNEVFSSFYYFVFCVCHVRFVKLYVCSSVLFFTLVRALQWSKQIEYDDFKIFLYYLEKRWEIYIISKILVFHYFLVVFIFFLRILIQNKMLWLQFCASFVIFFIILICIY